MAAGGAWKCEKKVLLGLATSLRLGECRERERVGEGSLPVRARARRHCERRGCLEDEIVAAMRSALGKGCKIAREVSSSFSLSRARFCDDGGVCRCKYLSVNRERLASPRRTLALQPVSPSPPVAMLFPADNCPPPRLFSYRPEGCIVQKI